MGKLLDEQIIFSQHVSELLVWMKDEGYIFTLGEIYRPPVCAWLNATPSGTRVSIETKTGMKKEYGGTVGGIGIINSLHCSRLAIDLFLFNHQGKLHKGAAAYEGPGIFWESLDKRNRWGGFFSRPDIFHFERRRG